MPIYEYKCLQCGTHYEKRQKVSDDPLTTCEKCHGQLEKQWSLSGFQFKGAGWYVTDYAGGKNKSGGDSTAGSETASKSSDAGTTASSSSTESSSKSGSSE